MPTTDPQMVSSTLPSPQVFDILVNLDNLLHRLLTEPASPDGHDPLQTPLTIKDYSTEALKIKNSLIDARKALQGLPDMDKSLIEQEAEIKRLERDIERKKQLLAVVATQAAQATKEDGS